MLRFKLYLFFFIIVIIFSGIFLFSCENNSQEKVYLATTTSVYDSGLLDELIDAFKEESDYIILPIAVGSGEAITMGEKGIVDVILVHSPKEEDKFMAEGYGIDRKDVMYNYFVIIGPQNDPADIKDLSATDAFKAIYEKKSLFITRGDNSGTHKKEMFIWGKAGIIPQGNWYFESGQGMGETLEIANEKQAYTLTDKGTFLALKDHLSLLTLVEGDKVLLNSYGIILVNPEKHKDVNINYKGAKAFADFVTGRKGQEIISKFGIEEFGEPLFYLYSTLK
ncbi:MAG: ABC transporter substrate-binding protein [Candidatus Humimicrobiaceae bacterium]